MKLGFSDYSDADLNYFDFYNPIVEEPILGSASTSDWYGNPILTYDYAGTEPLTPSVEPVNSRSGTLADFMRSASSVFNTALSTYTTVEQAKAGINPQIQATGVLPPGSRLTPQPIQQQNFFDTPTGKIAVPLGLAALIFFLAK